MPASGDRLLHYQLNEKIGEGGMGVVWRATDTTLGRSVAIKIPAELFYLDGIQMMSLPVETGEAFRFGKPRELFEMAMQPAGELVPNYDVSPDGRFIVVRQSAGDSSLEHLNVTLGWFGELRNPSP